MDWPPGKPPRGGAIELYKAKLARVAGADAAALGLEKAWVDESLTLARESVDRARSGAETVRNAAAAIATLYTAALTVSFSVTDNPLPPRGLIPLVLLAIAVAFATVYVAYQSRVQYVQPPTGGDDTPHVRAVGVVRAFVLWTNATVKSKRIFVRAAVVTLALAVPALGAPFISFAGTETEETELEAWPTVPTGSGSLAAIRYKAVVKEVAGLREEQLSAAPKREGHDVTWAAVFAAVWILLMVGVAAAELRGKDPDPDADENAGQLPTTTLAY
jgi:hypothetical protein